MMFPITHVWFAERVLGRNQSDVILGAIFPDIVITGCLDYKQTHYCGMEFYRQLSLETPSFAKAMISHTIDPMGLDYYGDECYMSGYKGYCFQKGKSIEEQVIEACNIPDSYGLWKAHNFIEMGIELDIYEQNPSLIEDLHAAFLDQSTIQQVAEPIEHFFALKRKTIVESFKRFSEFIEISKADSHVLASKYNLQMQAKHNINIDVGKAAVIIEQSRSIIKADIQEFFQYCDSNIESMLEGGDKYE